MIDFDGGMDFFESERDNKHKTTTSDCICVFKFLKSILGISYLNICICVVFLFLSAKLRSIRASFGHFQRNRRLSYYDLS